MPSKPTRDEIRDVSREVLIGASYIKDEETQLYKDLKEFFEAGFSSGRPEKKWKQLTPKITKELNELDHSIVATPWSLPTGKFRR